jgi:hypothetical protein
MPLISFVLDPDILEKTGDEIATLGEQLEQVFGWRSCTTGDGIIPIIERGDALCALHPLLETFYIKYPGNNVLNINIDAQALIDMVSEQPVVSDVTLPKANPITKTKKAAAERMDDADWNW